MIVRRAGLTALLLVLLATAFARGATVAVDARVVPYVFAPSAVTVAVGDTVVWTMVGEPHTVTSGTIDGNNVGHPDGRFDSGTKLVGEHYSLTFTEPGTFPYFCIVHADSQMKGTITVTAATTPAPTPAPTPRPTVRPTTPPPATPVPTVAPTPSPSPTAEPTPSQTAEPTPSPSPTPSPTPSVAPASPSAGPADPPAPDAPNGLAVVLIAGVVVAVAAGGGWWVLRRR